MEKLIDLHTHSTASDGSMTPAELVSYAKSRGLSAIALTDHDTVDGIEEALDWGERVGLEVVAGVEISIDTEPEIHILGYFFERPWNTLKAALDELVRSREERNPKIIKKLNELGLSLTMAEVLDRAKGKIVGRAHIAQVLVDKGYAEDISQAFDRYLSAGRPAYVKREKLTLSEGIKLIEASGGIPVLAHPVLLGMKEERLDDLLNDLKKMGLKGIEAYYAENTPGDTEMFLGLSKRHNLAVTGGSDFHGDFKNTVDIGSGRGSLKVPYALLEILKALAK